jgi:hypothetical protein
LSSSPASRESEQKLDFRKDGGGVGLLDASNGAPARDARPAALINTLMLQEVLAEDTWKAPMKPEDWRGLTPLFYQHVNPYGRFTLDLTQRLPLSLTNIA